MRFGLQCGKLNKAYYTILYVSLLPSSEVVTIGLKERQNTLVSLNLLHSMYSCIVNKDTPKVW